MNDICKIFGFFHPLSPCPHLNQFCSMKFRQPPLVRPLFHDPPPRSNADIIFGGPQRRREVNHSTGFLAGWLAKSRFRIRSRLLGKRFRVIGNEDRRPPHPLLDPFFSRASNLLLAGAQIWLPYLTLDS